MDTTIAALAVAALSVIATPITAWFTFRWTRNIDRERWQRDRDADAERWDRDELKRRVLRGEEAAKEILTDVDTAMVLLAQAQAAGKPDSDLTTPIYHHILQQAELLTDDEAQARIVQIASNLYYTGQTLEAHPDITLWTIGHTCSDAAHAILRAYLHGRPLPETRRMARLQRFHNAGAEQLAEIFADEDPLEERD